jgi:hypothetical protein
MGKIIGTAIRDLKEVPTGINMTVKHLDGTVVEYVLNINFEVFNWQEV